MVDIVGTLLTTPRRPLATSALPDAPVVDDHRRAHRPIAAALHVIITASTSALAAVRPPLARTSR